MRIPFEAGAAGRRGRRSAGIPRDDACDDWPEGVRTLAELFAWRVARSPWDEALREADPRTGRWRSRTWHAVHDSVRRFEAALAGEGVAHGDRVAILLPNGVDAACADHAALARAAVPVPMHALDNPASIAWILADSEATVLIADSDRQWLSIAAEGTLLPALRRVIVRRMELPAEAGAALSPRPALLEDWLDAAPAAEATPPTIPALAHDLAAIVYTSGTTGRPKGVMLTHANVLSNVRAAQERLRARADDLFLSLLPLSHTFERTAGHYLPLAAGSRVAYARSVAQLGPDLREVRPTVFVAVPRVYEKIHAQLLDAARGPARRALLALAIRAGWRDFERRQGRGPRGRIGALADATLARLLAPWTSDRLARRLGGRLRLAVSGGAPLAPEVARGCLGLGLALVQGYGMTETSPVVAVNTPDDNDPATVGRALPGVELRLGERQELEVRGPGVMRGYWKRPDETAAVLRDGWLRTGDQAAIEGGRLRILGRLKEIIVTATGEKIAPADVEQALLADPLFEQAFVFGDGRPFIGGVVVLGRGEWNALARSIGVDPAQAASLTAPAAAAAIERRMMRATAALPRHGQPRRVVATLEPWTVENSLLTPTLKLKRRNLLARFAGAIEALYLK